MIYKNNTYRQKPKRTVQPRQQKVAKKTPKKSMVGVSLKRNKSLKFLIVVTGVVLVARLFYLQVIQHDYYNNLAIAEQQKKFVLPASRGTLYFRDGEDIVPAVLNSKVYTLYADPNFVNNPDELANLISASLSLDRREVYDKLTAKKTAYSIIAKRLSKAQVDKLFKQKEKLIGVNFTAIPQRVYPEGSLAAQTLGFVNDDGKGQYGLEGHSDERLSGKSGILKAVTDVRGVPLSVDDASNIAKAPKNGEDLILTIDRNVQAQAEEALDAGLRKVGATKGSVIIIDPTTGAVRAMANRPNFDPAQYYKVGNDAYERFSNRVVTSPYEAGSVIKALTMASGINEGVVNKNSTYNNTGSVQVDDALIKNVVELNGTTTMTQVLQNSLNTGVVHVLSQLGGGELNLKAREKLYDYFTNKYGFGGATGIEQAGEVEGTIFGPKAVQGNNVRYANMAFGQGMNVTMVQTAAAFSAVVNGGDYYRPHVIEGVRSEDGTLKNQPPTPLRKDILNDDTSNQIKEMTRLALQETKAISNLLKPGYRVGGKTGTSQIIDQRTGKYSNENAVGSYLGYGGDKTPRYVIMVWVDDAKLSSASFAGSVAAAPIFAQISNWLIDYYNVKPM